MKKPSISAGTNWFRKYDHEIARLSLVGGFIFDSLTLRRIDALWENGVILFHLMIVATVIILLNLDEREKKWDEEMLTSHFWFVNILQFSFGGLLSAFVIFYFRSTTLSATWPFLLLLVAAFAFNESFKKHYVRIVFQTSLLFLSLFSFLIFAIPIIVHRIGPYIFVLSGLLSLVFIALFLLVLRRVNKREFQKEKKPLVIGISSIFLIINLFYFTHLIPPLPLALKDAEAYHSIRRDVSGDYIVGYEKESRLAFLKLTKTIKIAEGDPVYVYSAIFSPKGLDVNVVHEWQYFDKIKNRWVTHSTIPLGVAGGRGGGFRTYSEASNLRPGLWRVNIKTKQGHIIGRTRFKIIFVNTSPLLQYKTNI